MNDILTVTELALNQSCVKVGPCVYEQIKGVPIGGFLSKQCASIYLGFSEQAWVQDMPASVQSEWCPPGLSFSETVAATRYVDDLALVSSSLCAACLNKLPDCMYEKPVVFEATEPTEHGLPWLDVWLQCDGLDLRVHAHGVEERWRSAASAGLIELPTKFRLMPFQGCDLLDMDLLSALLNGKLNRLLSLDLSAKDMEKAVECELQIWVLHGYPLDIILKIWRRGKRYPAAIKHGREILEHAIKVCGSHACIPMTTGEP